MKADLHLHTVYSDGVLTPLQVAQRAREVGLDMFAVTDHDECRGFEALEGISGITAIPGIELAAEMNGEVHVLGLCIDWRDEALRAYTASAAASRHRRAQEMLERLRAGGVDVCDEDLQGESFGDVIGRPHIAAALVKKGYVKTVAEAFEKYLSSKTAFYVPQKRIDVAKAAAMIRGAGGLPVLAHPGLLKQSQLDALAPQLSALGFWGVEAYHPSHTDGQCVMAEAIARQQKLYVTAGSDYHNAENRVGIGEETRGSSLLQESLMTLKNESKKRNNYMRSRY